MDAYAHPPSPWLWLAAAAAFSPALAELLRQTAASPFNPTPLFAAVLLACGSWRDRSATPPARRTALVLLAAACCLELLGILGGAATLGRASLSLAIVGMARLLGRPPLWVALLSLWLVPIPVSVVEPIRTPLESAAAAIVAGSARLAGAPAVAVGPLVRIGGTTLALQPSDGGLHLAHQLALLGWYAASSRGQALPAAARQGLATALLAAPLQPLFLAAAGLLLSWGGKGAARAVLDVVAPCLLVLATIVWTERAGARRPLPRSRPAR